MSSTNQVSVLSGGLTTDETSTALKCSKRRVFELLAAGILVRGRRFGKFTVVTAESVQAALKAQGE